MPYHTVPSRTTHCHATLCHPLHTIQCHAVLCHAVLFYAIPCHATQCRAVPCSVIPSHAVPCGAAAGGRPVGRGLGQVLLTLLFPPLKPRPVRAPAQHSRQRRQAAQVRDSPTPPGLSGPPPCLWPPSPTWSGLGKLRHGQATALEKRCEPLSPGPTASLSLLPQEFGGLGVLGAPFSQAGGRSHPRIRRQPRRKRKENWERCPAKPAGAGARGRPGLLRHRTPTTFDPFEGVTLPPPRAVRTLYLQEGKANSLASPPPSRHARGDMRDFEGAVWGAPMGAARLGAWGRAVSLLLPAGSRRGMGEASDMDSGIMLHSGEKGFGGEGSFGVPQSLMDVPLLRQRTEHFGAWGHAGDTSFLEKALGK